MSRFEILSVLVLSVFLSGCCHQQPKDIVTRLQLIPTDDIQLGPDGKELERDDQGCGVFACLCEGQAQCGDLIASGRCKTGTIDCIFEPPAICLCELTVSGGPVLTSDAGDSDEAAQ